MNFQKIWIWFCFLLIFDLFLWYNIFSGGARQGLKITFFDVGEGDSHLIELPQGVQILIDGGRDGRVLQGLNKALLPADRYIDAVILTHTDLDHLGGLPNVLERYDIGVFLYNGRGSDSETWGEFTKLLNSKKIQAVILGEGDKITFADNTLYVLNPGPTLWQSGAPNEASIVTLLTSGDVRALFTGDIDLAAENYLLKKYNLDVDILKVAHHGSKFATSDAFLKEATPKIAVIQVGKNRYGHPAGETLSRLKKVSVPWYRNDQNGAVEVVAAKGKIIVRKEK